MPRGKAEAETTGLSVLDLAAAHARECALAAEKSRGIFGTEGTWRKPIESDGLAVVPKRIKEAEELCRRHGVPTDFTSKRGRPLLTSRQHRREVLKIFKMHDNQGGYSDG